MKNIKDMSEFLNEGLSETINSDDLPKEILDVLISARTLIEPVVEVSEYKGKKVYTIRTGQWYFEKEDLEKFVKCPYFFSMRKGGGIRQRGYIIKYPDNPPSGKFENDDSMILDFRK